MCNNGRVGCCFFLFFILLFYFSVCSLYFFLFAQEKVRFLLFCTMLLDRFLVTTVSVNEECI